MPKFNVLRRVDAWIDYVAEVEAENERAAAQQARGDANLDWKRAGHEEFWNALFVTLDEAGGELEETSISRG